MNIDINTRFITLIGTPLDQSFAARMQNAAYAAAGINMAYFYTETGDAHLEQIIDGIRYMPSFRGCAVTKPNKVRVLEYLDELDPFCRKIGACNTVVKNDEGRLVGYNTDGAGFLISIREEGGLDVAGSAFFCLGAGGVGRAMCAVLAHRGARKIYVADVFEDSARALADDINAKFAPVAEFAPKGDFSGIEACDAVLNATGVGMGASVGRSPLPEACVLPGRLYFDACYNPQKTQFLKNAEERGCKVLNGLGMSLYQGAVQIELWTGRRAPVDAMRRELTAILKERALGVY